MNKIPNPNSAAIKIHPWLKRLGGPNLSLLRAEKKEMKSENCVCVCFVCICICMEFQNGLGLDAKSTFYIVWFVNLKCLFLLSFCASRELYAFVFRDNSSSHHRSLYNNHSVTPSLAFKPPTPFHSSLCMYGFCLPKYS